MATAPQPCLLIIDDEAAALESYGQALRKRNIRVLKANNTVSAEEQLKEAPDAILLDLNLGEETGVQFLKTHRDELADIPVIILTGRPEYRTIRECEDLGAVAYLTKGDSRENIIDEVEKVLNPSRARSTETQSGELNRLPKEIDPFAIVGRSRVMLEVHKQIASLGKKREPVLITGETGAGKELVARALHSVQHSDYAKWVPLNAATMLPCFHGGELFGHAKGAFSGADRDVDGFLTVADKTTLFLDEIGEMPLELQAALLRVIDRGEYYRFGDRTLSETNVFWVLATNVDLEEAVQEGRFRKDLLYRINKNHIKLPSLRDRKEDIPSIAEHLLQLHSSQKGCSPISLGENVGDALQQFEWPGNVRELENIIVNLAESSRDGVITLDALTETLGPCREGSEARTLPASHTIKDDLNQLEREKIREALDACGGNKSQAAAKLGISRRTLYDKIDRFGLKESLVPRASE